MSFNAFLYKQNPTPTALESANLGFANISLLAINAPIGMSLSSPFNGLVGKEVPKRHLFG